MKVKKERKTNIKTIEIVKIACKKCKKNFGVDKNFIGVITCPYCGEYVEG